MKFTLCALAISCLAASMMFGSTARAEIVTFDVSGLSFTGDGTLTVVADPTLANVFDVTGITGSINGVAITGLLPCATYDLNNPCDNNAGNSFLYDNLFYPDGIPGGIPVFDFRGIGFALASGLDGDFAAFGTHQYDFITDGVHDNGEVVDFVITPEPDSFLLLATGLLGLAGLVMKKVPGRDARVGIAMRRL
jgi:hypothetical protein